MIRDAVLSESRLYRYSLSRIWDELEPLALFIGLNPSTADANEDDPTIRRCIRFARDWGCGGLLMGNLFALRATNPRDLARSDSPVGIANDRILLELAARAGMVIAAWGTKVPRAHAKRPTEVARLVSSHVPLEALGFTAAGHPRHPLYVRADTTPVPMPHPTVTR